MNNNVPSLFKIIVICIAVLFNSLPSFSQNEIALKQYHPAYYGAVSSNQYLSEPTPLDGNHLIKNLSNHPWQGWASHTDEKALDLSYDGGLFVDVATVVRGPYLQSGTVSSTIIRWRTSLSTDSKVWYGDSPTNLNQTKLVTGSRIDHEVNITGLNANTTYYYAIGDSAGQMEGATSEHYFKTAPTSGTPQPVTAWILGDCGTANFEQEAVRDAYYNYIGNNPTDLILLLGDNAYDDGLDIEYQAAIFDMYTDKLQNTMLWSCPGNHEYDAQAGLNADYYDIFSFPKNGEAGGLASGTEKYYAFDYGNIHFISLDAEDENRNPGSPMLTWLGNDLAATTQDWVVVIFHRPPYSKGSIDSDNPNEVRSIEMRENVLSICENHGVDLVLSGHSHNYQRSKLINGHYGFSTSYNPSIHDVDGGDGSINGDGTYVQNINEEGTVYVVTGSAGRQSSVGSHPVMYYSVNSLGSTVLEVNGGQMDVKFLTGNGVVDDHFTIVQNGTPSVSWTNPLNGDFITGLNPISLNVDASDSDGNVTQVQFFVDGALVGTDVTAPYSVNWTPPVSGNYLMKAIVTDNDNNSNTAEISVTVLNGSTVDIEVQISNGSDDVEEQNIDGAISFFSSDLELSTDGSSPQTVGMRFKNVNIPSGSTVTNAYIQFTVDENDSGPTNLTVRGENHDNAPAFSSSPFNVSNRAMTAAAVNWVPAAWSGPGSAGTDQQTPDLSAIVQEIISRPGWASANSMLFKITGTGERTAESYDGVSASAPTLHISYQFGGGNISPIVNWTNPVNGQVILDLNPVSLNVDAFDTDGNVTEVKFFVDGALVGTDFSAPYSMTWTPTAFGNYMLKATAFDDGGFATEEEISVEVQDGSIINIAVPVNNGNDDVEERSVDGLVSFTSSDLELGADGAKPQTVGIRFNNVNIPTAATVLGAYIQFVTDEVDSGTTNLIVRGQDHDNAPAFASSLFNVSNRTTTTASVNWAPASWSDVGLGGTGQQTPNLSAIVQEIIGRQGWSSGNSMVFTVAGTGERTAESYDGIPVFAPTLHIAYQLGGGNISPSVNWTDPTNGQVYTDLNAISLNVNASDSDGMVTQVQFFVNGATVGTDFGAPYSINWTPPVFGNYQLKAIATDDGGFTTEAEIAIDVLNGSLINLAIQVNNGSDDVEENSINGVLNFSSSDLELGNDGSTPQTTGLRFNNINIASTATVTNAYIQFTVDENDLGIANLTIRGEDIDNAPAFASSLFNVSNRAMTAAATNWSPAVWTVPGAVGTNQQTPDLTAVVQEIISRQGWSPGNSMVFAITGTGERTGESYEGLSIAAPTLHISYELGGGNISPSVTWTNPTNGQTFIGLDPLSLNVDASDIDGNVTQVQFLVNGAPVGTDFSAPYALNWTPSAFGIYTLTAIATDNGGFSTDQQITIDVQNGLTASISVPINNGDDDVEEKETIGTVNATSSDLELVNDTLNSAFNQTVGLRFNNLNIPTGVPILSAYVQFTVDEESDGAVNLTIKGEDIDNSPAFLTTDFNVSSRILTNASVNWSPPAWGTVGVAGVDQQTPDLSSLIQEIVNRFGWTANNSLSLIITGTGKRTAESYNGSSLSAPILHITYSTQANNLVLNADEENNVQKTKTLHLFPNPVSNHLNVHYKSNEGQPAFVELLDQTSKILHFQVLKTVVGNNEFQMDLSQLPNGLYFLRVIESENQVMEKLVISR